MDHEVHVCLGVQHSCSKFILCGRGGATYQYFYLWKNYVQGNCQHLILAVSLSLSCSAVCFHSHHLHQSR